MTDTTPTQVTGYAGEAHKKLTALFLDAMDWGRDYGTRLSFHPDTKETVSTGFADKAVAALSQLSGVQPVAPNSISVDRGALTMALNVLRRAGKTEVADALAESASGEAVARTAQGWQQRAEIAERNWKKCRQWAIAAGVDAATLGDDPATPWHEIRDAATAQAVPLTDEQRAGLTVKREVSIPGASGEAVAQPVGAEWQPIETAPKDGFHIQLFTPEIQFVGYWAAAGWVINAPGLPLMPRPPTHWKPLDAAPIAPVGEKQE